MFLTVKKSSMTQQGPQCGLHKVWDSAGNGLIGVTDMVMQTDHWELIKDCKTVSSPPLKRVFSELPWRVAAGFHEHQVEAGRIPMAQALMCHFCHISLLRYWPQNQS